jgi:hypothetical protein
VMKVTAGEHSDRYKCYAQRFLAFVLSLAVKLGYYLIHIAVKREDIEVDDSP